TSRPVVDGGRKNQRRRPRQSTPAFHPAKEDKKRKLYEGDAPREKPQLFRSRSGAKKKGIFPRVMPVRLVIGDVIPSVDQEPERKSNIEASEPEFPGGENRRAAHRQKIKPNR